MVVGSPNTRAACEDDTVGTNYQNRLSLGRYSFHRLPRRAREKAFNGKKCEHR